MKPYPTKVCQACATKTGARNRKSASTYHLAKCDVCGMRSAVTEPRDFGYPQFEGHNSK